MTSINLPNKYLLTVAVPVYNVGEYLPECLASIAGQCHENVEVLLVDDGSTDNSGQICDSYATQNKTFRVIHQKNRGLSMVRNIAIEEASGEYITFFDGDDIIAKGSINSICEHIAKYHPDMVCGYFSKFTDSRNLNAQPQIPDRIAQNINSSSGEQAAALLLMSGYFWPSEWNIISKRLIAPNKTRPKNNLDYKGALEDIDSVLEILLLAKRIVILPQGHYYYRQRQGSLSSRMALSYAKVDTYRQLLIKWERIVDDLNSTDLKYCLQDYLLYQYLIMLGRIPDLKSDERKALYKFAKSRKHYFKWALTKKTRAARIIYQVFGLRFLMNSLHTFLEIKS